MNESSSSAGPAHVVFEPDPIITGFTLPLAHSTIKRTVSVTVYPKEMAKDCTFRITGAARAEWNITSVDEDTGVISVDVSGVDATPQSAPDGDTWLTVVYEPDDEEIGQAAVIVVIPWAERYPSTNPYFDGDVVGENMWVDYQTVPAYGVLPPLLEALQANEAYLCTAFYGTMTIQVEDQFGNTLDDIYAGQAIYTSNGGNVFQNTNTVLQTGGTWGDPVGVSYPRPDVAFTNQVDNLGLPNPLLAAWENAQPPTPVTGTEIHQMQDVQIGGHVLNFGTYYRAIYFTVDPPHMTIYWPDLN